MNYTNDIRDYLALEIEILKKLDVEQINAALNLLDETRQKRGVFISAEMGEVRRLPRISRMTSIKAFLNTSMFRSGFIA